MSEPITIIIPALNEENGVKDVILGVRKCFKEIENEIILVDDGSSDKTGSIAQELGIKVLRNPKPNGYGNAIKKGILQSKYDLIGIIDADKTYPTDRFLELYTSVVDEGYSMAVGERKGVNYNQGLIKGARLIFKTLVEFTCGTKIPDVNSGMRVMRKKDLMLFFDSLSPGFSLTTTLTLSYNLNGFLVKYLPIEYAEREGKSKVNYFHDSLRALQVIVQSIILYNPLKIYLCSGGILLIGLLFCVIVLFLSTSKTLILMLYLFICSFIILLGLSGLAISISMNLNSIRKDLLK